MLRHGHDWWYLQESLGARSGMWWIYPISDRSPPKSTSTLVVSFIARASEWVLSQLSLGVNVSLNKAIVVLSVCWCWLTSYTYFAHTLVLFLLVFSLLLKQSSLKLKLKLKSSLVWSQSPLTVVSTCPLACDSKVFIPSRNGAGQ